MKKIYSNSYDSVKQKKIRIHNCIHMTKTLRRNNLPVKPMHGKKISKRNQMKTLRIVDFGWQDIG